MTRPNERRGTYQRAVFNAAVNLLIDIQRLVALRRVQTCTKRRRQTSYVHLYTIVHVIVIVT